jgi:hypothetical protein
MADLMFRAVVPAHIARRWNAIALQQLADAVPQLDEQIENERRQRFFAEDCADMWQQIDEIRGRGDEAGLTVDGQIVPVVANECEPDCWCCQQESRP